MNNNFLVSVPTNLTKVARPILGLILSLIAVTTLYAEIVELTIIGSWSESDFKVTARADRAYSTVDPKFDGKVFGVSPSAGSVTLRLRVSTDGAIFFPKGSAFTSDRSPAYSLAHDFYGYEDVVLIGDTFSFGDALWKTEGILARLEGPGESAAALWTDVDITKENPNRVSFRMFGSAGRQSADIFVGSRTIRSIGPQFLLWEYYNGEEIRSEKYIAEAKAVLQ